MARVVYVGPLGEVSVPALGIGVVKAGVPVEVPDAAADILLLQDVWVLEGSEAALAAAPAPAEAPAPKGSRA